MAKTQARLFNSITSATIMFENGWNLDFRILYTRIRSGEDEHAHKSILLDVFKREYTEGNNLVRGHAKNPDFLNVHESTFYGTRSDAEKMRLWSVFTRFRRILSAWVSANFHLVIPENETHSSVLLDKCSRGKQQTPDA